MIKKNEIILFLLIIILYLLFGQTRFVILPATKKCIRNESRAIFYLLEIGDSKMEIKQKLASLELSYLHLKEFDTRWVFMSPLEWGANNWFIYLFMVDDKLKHINGEW